jgi:uncharacterized membrane protein
MFSIVFFLMLDQIFWLFLLTLLPVFELRLTIPLGILSGSIQLPFLGAITGYGLPVPLVFAVCVIANALVSPIVFLALQHLLRFFLLSRKISSLYGRIVVRAQRKAKPYIEKYGFWGIAVFVGIPLPGTGAWTGTLACFLFGMSFKKTVAANTVGVLIAAVIVTAIVLLGTAGLGFLGI